MSSLKLIGCHNIEDVTEVSVGLGLQVVRVCCKDAAYLFITRNVEKSRKLLSMLETFGLPVVQNKYSLKSMEQIQVDFFRRDVCRGSQMSIYLYSMVLFWHDRLQEDQWLSRSLFVLKHQLFVCIEDLKQFSSLSESSAPSSYFFLDSSCFIINISDMVVDTMEGLCVTLTSECSTSQILSQEDLPKSRPFSWKFKWFSEESLYKFVSLLEALRSEASTCPLGKKF